MNKPTLYSPVFILTLSVFCLHHHVLPLQLFAQNMVPNASFEDFRQCPQKFIIYPEEFNYTVVAWNSANLSTPDYYHESCDSLIGVPHNWAGSSEPHSGKAYTGIYVWKLYSMEYREYLIAQLTDSMRKGYTYEVSLYFRLASNFPYFAKSLGVHFSKTVVKANHNFVIRRQAHIEMPDSFTPHTARKQWSLIQGYYTAEGGERYLTIGNFKSNKETTGIRFSFIPDTVEDTKQSSYLYIDDVSVKPIKNSGGQQFLNNVAQLSKGSTFVLNKVHFAFDKSDILPESFPFLDSLALYLTQKKSIKILLSGHTDNIGSDTYNVDLSFKRAQAISNYLQSKGIEVSRIGCYGYGASKPISPGNSPADRRENRRVELEVQ